MERERGIEPEQARPTGAARHGRRATSGDGAAVAALGTGG